MKPLKRSVRTNNDGTLLVNESESFPSVTSSRYRMENPIVDSYVERRPFSYESEFITTRPLFRFGKKHPP